MDCNDFDNIIIFFVFYYLDFDGDGYGNVDVMLVVFCFVLNGFVMNNIDCDDINGVVYLGVMEICDGVDNNCDGNVDEGFLMVIYYQDVDSDGFGNFVVIVINCMQLVGYVFDNIDCNDNDNNVYLGVIDIFGNGIDENCDGVDGVFGLNEIVGVFFYLFFNLGSEQVNLFINGFNGEIYVVIVFVEGKIVISQIMEIVFGNVIVFIMELIFGVYMIKVSIVFENVVVCWIKK